MNLTVLIPTLVSRRDYLARLMERLEPQLRGWAVIETFEEDDTVNPWPEDRLTIGEKRQALLERVDTQYCCSFDDDDLPTADYGTEICKALASNPDVVGFRLNCYTDGVLTGLAIHSRKCETWTTEPGDDGLYRHLRTPNHLNPVRTEMAKAVGFKAMNTGEDADYSRRLFERFSAMREHFVDRVLYEYFYRTRPAEPIVSHTVDGRLTRAGAEQAIREGGSAIYRGRMCTKIEQLAQ